MRASLKSLLAVVLVAVGLTGSAIADDEPKLKLALHEAGQAARRAGYKQLLVVVRQDVASQPVTDAALRDLENQAVAAVSEQKELKASGAEPARELARKTKARKPLTPADARTFKDAAAAGDAVLCVDYRESKTSTSVRLTLADADKVHFSESVPLTNKVTGVAGPDPKAAPQDKPKVKQPGIGEGRGPIGDNGGNRLNGGNFMQAPPKDGSTGYAVRTDGSKGTGGRTATATQVAAGQAKAEAKAGGSINGGAGGKAVSAADITTAGSKESPKAATNLAQMVVNFCVRNLGQQVGNGECWTLANEALKASGAQPAMGYTFGQRLSLKEIRPGDILQFTNARFDEPGYYVTMGAPNHTAVVYSIVGDRVFILQQNFSGKRTVGTFDINFNNMTSGDVEAFRAVPRTE